MRPLRASLQCFHGCPGELAVTAAVFRCPTCSGLLRVAHDTGALGERSAGEWKALFDGRLASHSPLDGSGVWNKREWIAPTIPDDHAVTLDEGKTSLLRSARLSAAFGLDELRVKQCGTSHTGSFKDLGMTVLVSTVHHAFATGALSRRPLACASTGDTSAALAAYGAAAGLPVVVLLPRGMISAAQLVQPLAHGAHVLALDGDFDACMGVVAELAARDAIYLANSMNPLRIEGQKSVALEIAQQLGWEAPDWVVLPSGNLGNLAALHAGFDMLRSLGLVSSTPRLVAAQAERANPLVRAVRSGLDHVPAIVAKPTAASAIRIGNPVSAPRALAALAATNGAVEDASEDEIERACALADRAGLYACPHTGVALAVVQKLRAAGTIKRHERVVVVSTAHGLKFTEFKVAALASERVPEGHNAPVELPADAAAVAAHIARLEG